MNIVKKLAFLVLLSFSLTFVHADEEVISDSLTVKSQDHFSNQTSHKDFPQNLELVDLNYLYPQLIFFSSVDLLYWKTYSEGLVYAVELEEFIVDPAPLIRIRGSSDFKIAEFPWEPGFRLSLGFSESSWDSRLVWARYKSDNKATLEEVQLSDGTARGPFFKRIARVWTVAQTSVSTNIVTVPSILNASFLVRLNTIDWEAGKSLAYNSFRLRPHFGVRVGLVDQKMRIRIDSPGATSNTNALVSIIDLTNEFRSVGIRVGNDARYVFNQYFSLFANGSISVLAGRFRLQEVENFVLAPSSPPFKAESRFARKAVRPCFQLAAGGVAGYNFYRNKMRVELTAGYEMQYWPAQTQLVRFIPETEIGNSPGDVTFHGLSLEGALFF